MMFTLKMPKKKAEFDYLIQSTWDNGYQVGLRAGMDKANSEARSQVAKTRMEALQALTKYASASGQTIQAFAEAMKSEAGQL